MPKMQLKKLVIKSSRSLRLRRCRDVLRRSSKRNLETNLTLKRASSLLVPVSRLRSKSVKMLRVNFRKLKISK